ncbi:MAG: HupE/UreJ family protein [Calditrichaeota bacterium]|nr:HupE/UreJ family protein [Calditrichota bacterium]
MSQFQLYLQLGIEHIVDWAGRDHILFTLVMICIYSRTDWKQLLWIISSFTIAHTLTLALSVLQIISVSPSLIELLIAITIFLTALENLFFQQFWSKRVYLSGFFGLIHGMGFSNYLRSLLGRESDILLPLFSFNLGVEIGQLLIVIGILIIELLVFYLIKEKNKTIWIQLVSATVGIQSLLWIIERVQAL